MARRSRGARGRREVEQGDTAVWETRALIALAFCVLFSAMAIGAVHTRTLVAVAVAGVFTAGFALKAMPGVRPSIPVWICLALSGWSMLQALPLPMSALKALAPATADVWSRSLEPLGTEPAWASLSLDPGASWREGCRFALYACILFSAGVIARRRRSPHVGAVLVFVAAVSVALGTALHAVSGVRQVWGIYEPRFAVQAWHVGPLLNPNNLAGYLNLGFFAGLGLAYSSRLKERRLLIASGLVVVAAVAVLSASRAGVALLPVGAMLFVFFVWRRGKLDNVKQLAGIAAISAAGAVGLALLGGSGAAWAELLNGSLDKLSLNHWMSDMVGDHPFFGIGRGAFESVSPAYQPAEGHLRFTHAEMFPLHWAIEWGLIASGAALLALGFVLRPSRIESSRVALAMYVGVLMLLAQNLFDLALEVPGVMVALAVAVGSLVPVPRPHRRVTTWRKARGIMIPVAGVATAVFALLLGRHDLERDRDVMRGKAEAAVRSEAPVDDFMAALSTVILRHPAEPYFPLLGALVANDREQQQAMPWIQRALERGESNGRIHLLVAHVLARHGATNQALMELRFATERDTSIREPVAALAVALTRSPKELLRAVPSGERGVPVLDALAVRLGPEGYSLDREILERDDAHVAAHLRLAMATIKMFGADERGELCGDEVDCRRKVEEHAEALERVAPKNSAGVRVRAALLVADGNVHEAALLLQRRCEDALDRLPCWHAAVNAAAETDDHELLGAVSDRLMAEACSDRTRCASTAERLGHVYRDRGQWPVALLYYQRALTEDESAIRLVHYARAAKRTGATRKARVALQRGLRRYPNDREKLTQQLQELTP